MDIQIFLGWHDTAAASGGNFGVLFVLGALATAAWVLFSKLQWRWTIMSAGAVWVVALTLTFVF